MLAQVAEFDISPMFWMAGASISTAINTVRLLGKYAFDESVGSASLADALNGGRQLQQLDEKNCHPLIISGAVIADALTPTVGNFMRGVVRGFRTSAEFARHGHDASRFDPVRAKKIMARRETIRRLFEKTTPIIEAVSKANLPRAFATGAAILGDRMHARLEGLAPLATIGDVTVGDVTAVAAVVTTPNSPEVALRRQRARKRWGLADETAEQIASKRTNDEQETPGKIARWSTRVMRRMQDKHVRLLRRAIYGTEDYGEIQNILAERILNGGCDLRQSPWECCEEQNLCINCSFLDRVFWAAQDAFEGIVEYYAGDLRTRFLPCVAQQAATVNYLVIPPAIECPADICAQPECRSDEDCQLAFGSPPPTCNPTLGRCILQDSPQCAGLDGETCFSDVGGGDCRTGECMMGCQLSGSAFPCGCRCQDTWVTKEKLVPSLFERFTELEVPCLLNYTCLVDSIRPDDVNTTIPDDQPFRNTWYNIKTRGDSTTPNIDVSFVASLDEAFDGLGTSIIQSIEDLVYQISSLGDNVEWAENFANEYVFCDYRDDLYCPLSDESPTFGCCSDLCEERVQGTTLFNGIVFALLILIIPVTLCNLFRVCAGCGACWALTALLLVIPLVQQFAYGGGVLCYTPGPLFLALPLLNVISTIGVALVFIAFSLCGVVVRCFTCNFCFGMFEGTCRVNAGFFSTIASVFCGGLIAFISIFAFVPGLSLCTSLDVYNLASELVPPCFPLSTVLVDRREAGAYLPCGQTLGGTIFDQDTIILCATTDLLPETRFLDGLDNILYAAERIEPGFNERLITATAGTPLSSIGIDYAPYHTTEAHESELVDGLSEACFWITWPSIPLSALLLLLDLLLAAFIIGAIILALALILTPIFWALYAMWLGLDSIRNGYVLRRDGKGGVEARDPNFFDGKPGVPGGI
jgi:hypothetical protein